MARRWTLRPMAWQRLKIVVGVVRWSRVFEILALVSSVLFLCLLGLCVWMTGDPGAFYRFHLTDGFRGFFVVDDEDAIGYAVAFSDDVIGSVVEQRIN